MSYYKTQKLVLRALITILDEARAIKRELDVDKIKLQIMLNYEYGDKAVLKLLNLLSTDFKYDIKDNKIIWRDEK